MPKKILVADDSPAFRKLEGEYLAKRGFELLYAENGAEAMRLALEHLPDLILLDVQMPVMDGVQVLAFLKKEPRTKDIPVVVVTTLGRDKNADVLRQAGAAGVLCKPIRAAELWSTVEPYLGDVKPS